MIHRVELVMHLHGHGVRPVGELQILRARRYDSNGHQTAHFDRRQLAELLQFQLMPEVVDEKGIECLEEMRKSEYQSPRNP
ncbi:hypothetical protein OG21DRAFT_567506 [Imleria badia]|nr:hypothetical protein OG21DRAFT_567506 [Imleria badia]